MHNLRIKTRIKFFTTWFAAIIIFLALLLPNGLVSADDKADTVEQKITNPGSSGSLSTAEAIEISTTDDKTVVKVMVSTGDPNYEQSLLWEWFIGLSEGLELHKRNN